MGRRSPWWRWAPFAFAGTAVVSLMVFPAWITFPVALVVAVLYLIFSPAQALAPARP